jgi:hypothetical protein
VVNADAVELTGEEILEAINEAGLKKRQGMGLEEKTSNDVPLNAGAQAYAGGGQVDAMTPEAVAAGGKPVVPQTGGNISTEKTITIEMDGKHLVIPTIINGVSYSPDAAVQALRQGKNKPLGVFNTPQEAQSFAEQRSMALDRAFGGSGRLMKGPSNPATGSVMPTFARGGRVNRFACAGL